MGSRSVGLSCDTFVPHLGQNAFCSSACCWLQPGKLVLELGDL